MSEVILERIKTKVKSLVETNNDLRQANEHLNSELSDLQRKMEEQKTEMETLNEKVKMLKMAKSLEGGSEENRTIKLKINEMVKEIDKCIALINK